MVPVAWATGRLCDSWVETNHGSRLLGFAHPHPSYTLAHNPHMVVFLQALDGIGAGIYGVAIVAFTET